MFITRLILLLTTQAASEVTLFQKREERYPASHLQGAQSKNCGSNLIKYHTFEVSRQQHRQQCITYTSHNKQLEERHIQFTIFFNSWRSIHKSPELQNFSVMGHPQHLLMAANLHLTAQDRLRLLISGEQSSNFRRTTTFLATDKYTSLLRDVTREDPLAIRAGA